MFQLDDSKSLDEKGHPLKTVVQGDTHTHTYIYIYIYMYFLDEKLHCRVTRTFVCLGSTLLRLKALTWKCWTDRLILTRPLSLVPCCTTLPKQKWLLNLRYSKNCRLNKLSQRSCWHPMLSHHRWSWMPHLLPCVAVQHSWQPCCRLSIFFLFSPVESPKRLQKKSPVLSTHVDMSTVHLTLVDQQNAALLNLKQS